MDSACWPDGSWHHNPYIRGGQTMQYRDLEADIHVDPAFSPEFVNGIKYTL